LLGVFYQVAFDQLSSFNCSYGFLAHVPNNPGAAIPRCGHEATDPNPTAIVDGNEKSVSKHYPEKFIENCSVDFLRKTIGAKNERLLCGDARHLLTSEDSEKGGSSPVRNIPCPCPSKHVRLKYPGV